MKIIASDNLDREGIRPILVAENVHPVFGKEIVDFWRENMEGSMWYPSLKPDDYTNYDDHNKMNLTEDEIEEALDTDPSPYRMYVVNTKKST